MDTPYNVSRSFVNQSAVSAVAAPEPQTRITCGSQLSTGLDTLRLSLWVAWPADTPSPLFEQLAQAKNAAQELDVSAWPIDVAGHQWNVQRSGTKQYSFHLVRGDIHLLFNRRDHQQNIANTRLEIGSISCWSPGYQAVYDEAIRLIESLGGAVSKERVSEVHLTADLIGLDISSTLAAAGRDHWICRALNFGQHYEGVHFSGMTMGRGGLMLRVYDKVLELKKQTHKQRPFADIWGVSRFDDKPVIRVEFQLRRKVLRQFSNEQEGFKIDTLFDLRHSLASLWQYLTQSWARLAQTPPDRSNRHQDRVEISDFWSLVQSACFAGQRIVQRVKQYLHKDIDRLTAMTVGLCMSIAAAEGRIAEDFDDVLSTAYEKVSQAMRAFYQTNRPEFFRRMEVKLNESWGIPIAADFPF